MKQRNTDIDWIRAILIILMILIHIVSFGNAYPHLKAGILSFMMPTFLIITGYLVNIEKSPKEMGRYLMCLALPYVIMVTGFSVLSYFMPVRHLPIRRNITS
jgi:fucose 4-O-acetylase-like acetyltransferase